MNCDCCGKELIVFFTEGENNYCEDCFPTVSPKAKGKLMPSDDYELFQMLEIFQK